MLHRSNSHLVECGLDWVFVSLQVRSLEQQNKLLETEIEAYQNRFEKPVGLRLLYEEQLKELKKIAEQMRVQRVRREISRILPLLFLCLDTQEGIKFTPHRSVEDPPKQRYKTSTWCFQSSLPGNKLISGRQFEGDPDRIWVSYYSCCQMCFMHRWDDLIMRWQAHTQEWSWNIKCKRLS